MEQHARKFSCFAILCIFQNASPTASRPWDWRWVLPSPWKRCSKQDLRYELPFLPTSSPQYTYTLMPTYTSRRSVEAEARGLSFGESGGCFLFLMLNFLPLLYQRHFTSCWLGPSYTSSSQRDIPDHIWTMTAQIQDCVHSVSSPPPPSFHPVRLINYLLFSKQITFVNLWTSATNPYSPVLLISRVQRPMDFFHDSQTQAFTPAVVPGFSIWFGLIWFREQGRIIRRTGSARNKREPKIELTSHLSTKKPFTSSPQWRTNAAHSPLRQSHQFLAIWMEAGTCKRQLQPPKRVRETTHPTSRG